jgi:hypothetical protein
LASATATMTAVAPASSQPAPWLSLRDAPRELWIILLVEITVAFSSLNLELFLSGAHCPRSPRTRALIRDACVPTGFRRCGGFQLGIDATKSQSPCVHRIDDLRGVD